MKILTELQGGGRRMEERKVPGQKQDMKAWYRISSQIMDGSLYKNVPVVIII